MEMQHDTPSPVIMALVVWREDEAGGLGKVLYLLRGNWRTCMEDYGHPKRFSRVQRLHVGSPYELEDNLET